MADDTQKRETTSPLVAAAQGQTPMQAAMSNTPASKQGKGVVSATSNLVKGNNHLGTSNVVPGAPKQVPSEAGVPIPGAVSDEQRARQQSKYTPTEIVDPALQMTIDGVKGDPAFSKLGSMGATIQNYVAKSVTDLYSGAGKTDTTKLTTEQITEAPLDLDTEERKNFDIVINAIESAPDDASRNEQIGKLASLIGTADPSTGKVSISWDQVKSVIGEVDSVVGEVLAKGLADTIKVDTTILNSLGYTSQAEIDQLETLIGVDDLSKLSLQELQQKSADYLNTRFKEVEKLRADVSDPFASASEREMTLENLRDLGYTGTLASKEILDEVGRDLASADKNIKFNGQVYGTVEELLSDDTITKLVSDYLANPDKETQLPAALVAVIDRNRDTFEDIMSELKTEVGHFNDVQKSWEDVATGLSDDLKSIIGYTPSKVYTTKFEAPKTGLLSKALNPNTSKEDKLLYSNIANNVIKNVGKDLGKTVFDGLDDKELEQLKSPEIAAAFSEGLRLGSAVDVIQADTNINMQDTSDAGKANVLSRLFGVDSGKLVTVLDNLEDMADLGDKNALALIGAFDQFMKEGTSVGDLLNSFDVLLDAGNLGKVTNLNSLPGLLKSKIDEAASVSGIYNTLAKIQRGEAGAETIAQDLMTMNITDVGNFVKKLPKDLAAKLSPIVRSTYNQKIKEQMTKISPNWQESITEFAAKPSNQNPPEWAGKTYKALNQVRDMVYSIPNPADRAAVLKEMAAPITSALFTMPSGENYTKVYMKVANPSFAKSFLSQFKDVNSLPEEYRNLYGPNGEIAFPSNNNDLWADLGGVWDRYEKAVTSGGGRPSMQEFASLIQIHKKFGGSLYSPGKKSSSIPSYNDIKKANPNATQGAGASTSTQGGKTTPGGAESQTSGLGDVGLGDVISGYMGK
jgi:hypothetical protein